MTESTIQSRILRALGSRPDIRLFRNQVGAAYVGHKPTDLTDARFIRYGLTPGSGDLIGWKSVTVTPDMVGRRLAVFLSVEVKTATGRPKPEQVTWKNRVNEFGGIAVIARSEEEAMNMIETQKPTQTREAQRIAELEEWIRSSEADVCSYDILNGRICDGCRCGRGE
jgi:hypothetical protein